MRAKYKLMSLLCVFLYNEHPRCVNNIWATLKCHSSRSTDRSARSGGTMSYWPIYTGWRHHIFLTTAQGEGIMSYWPLCTGERHHVLLTTLHSVKASCLTDHLCTHYVLLTTLHSVKASCLTDHSAQCEGIMSYWPLCTVWRHHVLLTTSAPIMSYWQLCTVWRHHVLLTTLHSVKALCLTDHLCTG